MIPRENHVCSFKQAEKLLRLGLNLETYWFYRTNGTLITVDNFHWAAESFMPAYTVAELGVLLGCYQLNYDHYDKLWRVTRQSSILPNKTVEFITVLLRISPGDENQARAAALIWLIENDFVKVKNLKL